ncbi:hypothetical protein VP01_3173g2 [Puccinia sorghi]|uniref:Uncharacterized protein n=1 Tax=Puccinia sorghi TaxID=27349 RepID=A0A0L6UYN5_9BASI|nr:hypothetical protein VP01_3173g2 [Puccinia sorghi]
MRFHSPVDNEPLSSSHLEFILVSKNYFMDYFQEASAVTPTILPKVIQPSFDSQSLCILHSDCAKASTYAKMWSLDGSLTGACCMSTAGRTYIQAINPLVIFLPFLLSLSKKAPLPFCPYLVPSYLSHLFKVSTVIPSFKISPHTQAPFIKLTVQPQQLVLVSNSPQPILIGQAHHRLTGMKSNKLALNREVPLCIRSQMFGLKHQVCWLHETLTQCASASYCHLMATKSIFGYKDEIKTGHHLVYFEISSHHPEGIFFWVFHSTYVASLLQYEKTIGYSGFQNGNRPLKTYFCYSTISTILCLRKSIITLSLQKKLTQLPAVDMQKVPGSFSLMHSHWADCTVNMPNHLHMQTG